MTEFLVAIAVFLVAHVVPRHLLCGRAWSPGLGVLAGRPHRVPLKRGTVFDVTSRVRRPGFLNVPPHDVQPLMRSKEVTSVCERDEGEHEGNID